MVALTIYFKNGTVLSLENVTLDESLAFFTVHTGPGEWSVVTRANVLYYDVEEITE